MVNHAECDGGRSNTSAENSQLWITKQAIVTGAITVLLNHGASVLFVTGGWPPVTLNGTDGGDHVVGGEARKPSPLLSKLGRAGVSVVERAHAGERFVVKGDLDVLHVSSRYDDLEVEEKAIVAGPVGVLPNHRGVRWLAVSFGPLRWRHDEDRIMSSVSHKSNRAQRAKDARGVRAAHHRRPSKPLGVETHRVFGRWSQRFQSPKRFGGLRVAGGRGEGQALMIARRRWCFFSNSAKFLCPADARHRLC